MASATAERETDTLTASANPEVREWMVDGEMQSFSLRPFAPHERPLYWNPMGGGSGGKGQAMLWKHWERSPQGYRPTVAAHQWNYPWPGSFSPRNEWERMMTEEWMKVSLKPMGCTDPKKWEGWNHPEEHLSAEHRFFTCADCSWRCGNFAAFQAHQRYLRHQKGMKPD